MRTLLLPIVLGCALPYGPAIAQTSTITTTIIAPEPAVDAIVERFFKAIPTSPDKALTDLFAPSKLFASKMSERQVLASQITTVLSLYGPIVRWERIEDEAKGTLLRRQVYLLKHRDAVIRWQFVFMREGDGWVVAWINFDDQVQNWF